MTDTLTRPIPAPLGAPEITIEAAIARFGAARVMAVALGALIRGRGLRQAPALPEAMSNHLRRDIGLAPRQAAPPPLDALNRHMW